LTLTEAREHVRGDNYLEMDFLITDVLSNVGIIENCWFNDLNIITEDLGETEIVVRTRIWNFVAHDLLLTVPRTFY